MLKVLVRKYLQFYADFFFLNLWIRKKAARYSIGDMRSSGSPCILTRAFGVRIIIIRDIYLNTRPEPNQIHMHGVQDVYFF